MNQPLSASLPTPGFAITITRETEFHVGTLIVEDEDGNYEPIGHALNINEAEELSQADVQHRRKLLAKGDDAGLCPYYYKLWARGLDGAHRIAATFDEDGNLLAFGAAGLPPLRNRRVPQPTTGD